MKIKKGNPLEELVKGSMDYTMQLIRDAFRNQFPSADGGMQYYVNETFADHVIVSDWDNPPTLKTDEYWKVMYSKEGDSYTFAARDAWEVVELAYQPQTPPSPTLPPKSESTNLGEGSKKKKGKRIEERIQTQGVLEEAQEGKPRRIRFEKAMTAGVVNGNGRRYPASVLSAAVAELSGHLHESAGQARAIQVLGEAEHPSDKGGRPNLLETVTKWDEITFDGQDVTLVGHVVETSKGKDILTLMENGVMPGASLRGYGDGKILKEGGEKIFEVTDLHITGFDLVLEPSFENAAELIESLNQGETDMNIEELLKLLKEHPELFAGVTEAQIKTMGEAQLKGLEEKIREMLGVDEKANIAEALKATTEKARKYDESQKQAEVAKAIAEATKDLPFGERLNKQFVEALTEAAPKSAEDVKALAESKRREYGKIAAELKLSGMGFTGKGPIQMLGSVLENETGVPEFARAAFEITESLRKNEMRSKTSVDERAESRAAVFTAQLLERFDQLHQRKLMAEAQQFNEAELTSDLNLPYSVSRAIIAEAFPNLVAANLFDVGIMNSQSERIFFEAFSGETGYTVSVADEAEAAGAEDVWYDLDNKNLVPGTVVVTSDPAGTTYVEGTDFVIDYELGRIRPLGPGSIGANDLLVSYDYNAIRKGENAEIERAKVTLSYQTIEAAADRLADYISHEAIVFSRSQLGWDAVARTMANIIRQTRLNIDRVLIEKGLAAALSVASNTGGTYDISADTVDSFVEKLGAAKVLVANRFYEPTGILMSVTNADLLSNWTGFKRDGFPNAVLNAAGFAGGVKGLPVFASTQMRESWCLVMNRELVMHRVFQPMTVKGPFPTYSNGKLVAAEQYYSEEYNASLAPVGAKGSYVKVQPKAEINPTP